MTFVQEELVMDIFHEVEWGGFPKGTVVVGFFSHFALLKKKVTAQRGRQIRDH